MIASINVVSPSWRALSRLIRMIRFSFQSNLIRSRNRRCARLGTNFSSVADLVVIFKWPSSISEKGSLYARAFSAAISIALPPSGEERTELIGGKLSKFSDDDVEIIGVSNALILSR